MPWNDGPLVVYHGTDSDAGEGVIASGPNWRLGNPHSDFGRGFYTTTLLREAKFWADLHTRTVRGSGKRALAMVIKFSIPRDVFDGLNILCFVLDNSSSDYWDFVDHSRTGQPYHRIRMDNYHVVFGPVSRNWPRHRILRGYDQVSFHTDNCRSMLQDGTLESKGSPLFF